MKIRNVVGEEFSKARGFYHALIEGMEDAEFEIGWKKDIYPSIEFLEDSIARGELYAGWEEEKMIAAMVLNHQYNDGYEQFQWPTEAAKEEVSVIHALGVHPGFSGKGYARQMVNFAVETARKRGQKVLRLDVLKGNVPAEKLYTGLGFRYLHTLEMYYEDTGWTDYELYELVL